MKPQISNLLSLVSFALISPAFAQSPDADYCDKTEVKFEDGVCKGKRTGEPIKSPRELNPFGRSILSVCPCTYFPPGSILKHWDLSGRDLRGSVFENADLSGANFVDARVQKLRVIDSRLDDLKASRVDFSGAYFEKVSITGTSILVDSTFLNATLHEVDFTKADLRGALFQFSTITNSQFVESQLNGAQFVRVARLAKSDFTKAQLRDVAISESDFDGVIMVSARMQWGEIFESTFQNANLAKIDLTGTGLKKVDFTGADLSGARLLGGSRPYAVARVMPRATLPYRPGTQQQGENPVRRVATNTFYKAKLAGADLTGLDLGSPTNFSNADLSGATLYGTNFSMARLSQTKMKDMRIDDRTRLPLSTKERDEAGILFFSEADKDRHFRYHNGRCVDEEDKFGLSPGFLGECGEVVGLTQSQVELKGFVLTGAEIYFARIEKSLWKDIQFEGGVLSGQFYGGSVEDSNFENATLQNIVFDGTKFKRIKFKGAHLISVRFESADLTESGIEEVQHLEDCAYDPETKLPFSEEEAMKRGWKKSPWKDGRDQKEKGKP